MKNTTNEMYKLTLQKRTIALLKNMKPDKNKLMSQITADELPTVHCL